MTRLRQLMIEELQRHNFAETTIRSYSPILVGFQAVHRRLG